MRGLGDLIAWCLTPLEPLIRRLFGKRGCGCQKRQNALNDLIPFESRPMTEDEIQKHKEKKRLFLEKIQNNKKS